MKSSQSIMDDICISIRIVIILYRRQLDKLSNYTYMLFNEICISKHSFNILYTVVFSKHAHKPILN